MIPIYVLGLLVSIFFCGLTLDIGRMEMLRVQMQNAAEAAATGAEIEVEHGTSTWAAFGKQEAAANGFTDGVNYTTVTVVQSPSSGQYQGRYDAVQTTITRTFKTLFMGALNGGTYTVTVQNSALVAPCNYFLGGSNSQYTYALKQTGTTLSATCPIYINSNFSSDSSSKLYGFGVTVSGSAGSSSDLGAHSQQSQGPGSSPPSLAPTYGVRVMSDPLANYGQPAAFSSCGVTSYSITSGSQTIYPGTYCGTSSTRGLTINNATVTLSPGVYTITGGMKWDNSTISGSNVTLFFTNGNGAAYGQVLIGTSGPCNLSLTAPTNYSTGTQSLLFFLDRNWTNTSATDFQVAGNGTFTGDGLWYMPFTGLSIATQQVNFSHYGSFIARNAVFSNTTLTTGQDNSSFPVGSLFRQLGGIVQ